MSGYTALAVINVAVCLTVVSIAYITGSPWALLGLFFLYSTYRDKKDKP